MRRLARKRKNWRRSEKLHSSKLGHGLTEIRIPSFPPDYEALLGRTISDLSTEAERRVSEHLAVHEMQGSGERWVQEGLGYIRGDACPFCNQSLQGVDLIGAYRAFFGETYNELKGAITSYRKQLEILFGDRAIADTEKPIASNEGAVEFWGRFCSLSPAAAFCTPRVRHVTARDSRRRD